MFDRYLRTYTKQSRRRNAKESDIDLKEFRIKWMEFVTDDV